MKEISDRNAVSDRMRFFLGAGRFENGIPFIMRETGLKGVRSGMKEERAGIRPNLTECFLGTDLIVLETERLILRKMLPSDFRAMSRFLSDPEVMKHYPHPMDEKEVRHWIAVNRERYRNFGFGLWAVVLKSTNEVIGDAGLSIQNIHDILKPEIGFHIRQDCQKKGYASEAAGAVLNWTFEHTPFPRVFSYMKKENEASQATARSINMKCLEEYMDAQNHPVCVYGISREEWQKAEGNK